MFLVVYSRAIGLWFGAVLAPFDQAAKCAGADEVLIWEVRQGMGSDVDYAWPSYVFFKKNEGGWPSLHLMM